jgi:hypothetical protein
MRRISKAAYVLAGLLFVVLLVHAYLPGMLGIAKSGEKALLFFSAASLTLGFLLSRNDPLPYAINEIWFVVCVYTVIAFVDTLLGLGHIEGGLFSLWPLHVFTLYGAWLIATHDEIEPEHVRRLWVVAIAMLMLSPLFNYG